MSGVVDEKDFCVAEDCSIMKSAEMNWIMKECK